MKFLAVASLFAAVASAQDCDGAPVLDKCLETTESQMSICATTDYNCLCEKATIVFQCFGNAGCGNDARASSYNNVMQSYCAYVTTTSVAAPTTTTNTASSENTDEASDDTSVTTTDTAADSEATTDASASQDGDGESSGTYLAMNAGSMLAAVAGVVVALL